MIEENISLKKEYCFKKVGSKYEKSTRYNTAYYVSVTMQSYGFLALGICLFFAVKVWSPPIPFSFIDFQPSGSKGFF